MRPQLRFQRRAQGAGLDSGGAGRFVHLQHPVQTGQIDGADLVRFRRFHPGDDGASAAVGDGNDVGVGAPIQRPPDLFFGSGVSNYVRRVGKLAVEPTDAVAEAAPVGVRGPVMVVHAAKLGDQRVRREARLAEVEIGVGGRRGRRKRCPISAVDPLGHRCIVCWRRLPVFHAPGPETAARHRVPPVRAKIMVGVSGFEPPTSTSRTWRASHCATPRLYSDCSIPAGRFRKPAHGGVAYDGQYKGGH